MSEKKTNNCPEPIEESRRRFLKSAGKLAVYTPPAMLLMMQPSYAHFNRSGGRVYRHGAGARRPRDFDWESFLRRLRRRIWGWD